MSSNINVDSLARRLAEKAVAARVKQAWEWPKFFGDSSGPADALTPANVPQAQQFDFSKMLGQATQTAGDYWSKLSPEQQWAIGGAGVGGTYGALTHRPGHFLEDTAYGAGIGGLGGYGAGLAYGNTMGLNAKSKEERDIEWRNTRDTHQAQVDKQEQDLGLDAGSPKGFTVSKNQPDTHGPAVVDAPPRQGFVQQFNTDVVDNFGKNPQTAGNLIAAGGGGYATQQAAIRAMHSKYNPFGPSVMKDYWATPSKQVQNNLTDLKIVSSLPKPNPEGVTTGKPTGFPQPGELPMPNTTAGLKVQKYDNAVAANKSIPEKWDRLTKHMTDSQSVKQKAYDARLAAYNTAEQQMYDAHDAAKVKYDNSIAKYDADVSSIDANHAKAMADYQKRLAMSAAGQQVSPIPVAPIKPAYPQKPGAPLPPPVSTLPNPGPAPAPVKMPPRPQPQPLPPQPGFRDRSHVMFKQLTPGQRWVTRGAGVGGALLAPVAANAVVRNIPESFNSGANNWSNPIGFQH